MLLSFYTQIRNLTWAPMLKKKSIKDIQRMKVQTVKILKEAKKKEKKYNYNKVKVQLQVWHRYK